MKLKNLYLALKDQGPFSRFVRNFFKGHIFGLFSINSHIVKSTGRLKIMYNTKKTAEKAAAAMLRKNSVYFSNYKCIYCDGYHIGKNSSNKS